MTTLIYCLLKVFYYCIFKIFFRLEVKGADLVPKKGGVIIASNHASYLDPPIIGAVLRRRATFLAKRYLFNVPIIKIFLNFFAIPVDEDKIVPSTMKEAIKRLKKGELVVIFPEGRRSEDGSLLDAKRGIGVIASLSSVPIIPAFIEGSHEVLPVGAKFPRPGKLRVYFGQPLMSEKGKEGEFQETITKNIMDKIKELKSKNV